MSERAVHNAIVNEGGKVTTSETLKPIREFYYLSSGTIQGSTSTGGERTYIRRYTKVKFLHDHTMM